MTYLASTGFSPFVIGLVRSLNVVFELSATFIAPRLMKRMGPYRAGMWFLSWQIAWLVASVTFFWREQGVIAASGLAAGAILSRIGLWGYDLSASLIIQTVRCFDRSSIPDDNLLHNLSTCPLEWPYDADVQ